MSSIILSDPQREIQLSEDLVNIAVDFVISADDKSETEILIIRSHLHIERGLENIIESSFAFPKAILDSEFSFSKKYAVVKALIYSEKVKELLNDIKLVNQVRNELAHNLKSKKFEKLLLKLSPNLVLKNNYELDSESLDALKIRLAQIYGRLFAANEIIKLKRDNISITVE